MINTKTKAVADNQSLNAVETDTIGEILNISMGAAATAISIMLSRKVNITTPNVKVVRTDSFEYKELEPAVGIEIEYIQGLHGSNILIMNKKDVKKIVDLLISGEGGESDDNIDLDEIHISALGEIMNQMMGSSSTALASFLNTSINISTPKPFELANLRDKLSSSGTVEYIVSVSFRLQVEDLLDSEFITVLPVEFTKELVKNASATDESDGGADAAEEPEEDEAPSVTGHTQVPSMAYTSDFADKKSPEPKKKAPAPRPRETKNVSVTPLQLGKLNDEADNSDAPDQVNLGLVMGVELNVTVEIGRARKQVKDVLALRQGSIVELDKQAGEPVDVVVNGQLIARGDVVVIDDNFGVRITEIVNKKN